MVKIVVVGGSEFIVGFQLAGIKDTIEVTSNYFNELRNMKSRKDIGIVVVDEKIMEGLDIHQRLDIEASVEPVFIPVSKRPGKNARKEQTKRLTGKNFG